MKNLIMRNLNNLNKYLFCLILFLRNENIFKKSDFEKSECYKQKF